MGAPTSASATTRSSSCPTPCRLDARSIDLAGSPRSKPNAMFQDGLAFHTIVPQNGGCNRLRADLDGSLHDAVAKASKRYGAKVEYRWGEAEFIGTQRETRTDREQRDDARRTYKKIVRESPVQGSQAVWQSVHLRWGEALNPDNDSFVRDPQGDCGEWASLF